MKTLMKVASAGVLSIAIAGSVVSPVFAWHPKGQITKSVRNVTTNGSLEAADTAATAVAAKPGDILEYVVVVSNVGAPAANHDDDMAYTVMTDSLPAGVSLVSDPNTRTMTNDMGTITPGKSDTVKFQVKVTAKSDTTITNKACFTADSIVKDNPQQGCDTAVVKVTVPPTPTPTPTPTQTQTPSPTPAPTQPAVLPNTGAGSTAAFAGLLTTVLGYAAYALRLKRKTA